MNTMEQSSRQNLRQHRATGLAREIAKRIEQRLLRCDLSSRERTVIFYAALEILMEAGAELVTDRDWQDAGLPPRGQDGWTYEELAAMERKRIEVMTAPIRCMVTAPVSTITTVIGIEPTDVRAKVEAEK